MLAGNAIKKREDYRNSQEAANWAALGLSGYFRQLAGEQFLASYASRVPAFEHDPAGHVTLVHTPPAQFPLPFIRSADASVVRIGAAIEKLSNASKRAAKAMEIHFMHTS